MRAIGYVRVSTEEQARGGVSLDVQERSIRAFIEAKGWELVGMLRDEGWSAKDLRRPGLERIMADLRKRPRPFDVLVVSKIDRLTRRQRDLWHLLEDVLEPGGAGLASVTEPFDTTSGMGRAFLGMLGVFAQLERDMIRQRTREAMAHKRDHGQRISRLIPYGFHLEPDGVNLIPQQNELAVIGRIRQRRADGGSYGEIAEELNAEQLPAKIGGRWYASTVRAVLRTADRMPTIHKGTLEYGVWPQNAAIS